MSPLTASLRNRIARHKDIPPERLGDWGGRDLCAFGCNLLGRTMRGLRWRLRFGASGGLLLSERRVRVYHPRYVRAGARLNLEEGCEIVGLSRQGVVFGNRCTIGRFATIRPTNVLIDEVGEGMRMGDNSNIGAYSYVGCSGFVDIGNRVMMGPRVNLLGENHSFNDLARPIKDQGVVRKPIVIEDDCWIGAGATILAGVTVHSGAVIAAGAVVTHDVPPHCVVAGVPAKVIKERR